MKFIEIKKKDLLTIPNILCYFRLILIPVFVVLYLRADSPADYYLAAAAALIASLTDLFDGKIARKYNQITEFGKFIDPLADKLMQGAMLLVLLIRVKWMWLLVTFFVVKEGFMGIAGFLMLQKGKKLDGAKYIGKVCTTVLYSVMFILICFPSLITNYTAVVNGMLLLCAIFMMLSFVSYVMTYIHMYKEFKEEHK
ncbi:MAG: CDP-alcohol phosphatidyltransferase family protein [Lachnospiraceae bacterium]|nr:CDP-alcohol phosphatidyltransferase family protein [Lachnospiraceae bacterium]